MAVHGVTARSDQATFSAAASTTTRQPGDRLALRDPFGLAGGRIANLPSHHLSVRAPTQSDSAIGRKIRELRRARIITQKELAGMVGVTGAQLHRYETGTTRVAASRLIAIAESLGVQADVLIGSSTTEAPPPKQPPPGRRRRPHRTHSCVRRDRRPEGPHRRPHRREDAGGEEPGDCAEP